jgi:cell division protein FtsQ
LVSEANNGVISKKHHLEVWILARASEKRIWAICLTILATIALFGFVRSPFFNLQQIVVQDNALVSKTDLLALASVGQGTNIFQVPTGSVKKNILLHPLIKQVDIRRQLPSTLIIKVLERKPLAMIPVQDGFVMVDEQGLFLQRSDTWPKNTLPIISGVQLPENLNLGQTIPNPGLIEGLKLLQALPSEMRSQVGELYCGNRDKLVMYTRDGLEIRLGVVDQAAEKFALLQQFLSDKNYNPYRQGYYVDLTSGKLVLGKR